MSDFQHGVTLFALARGDYRLTRHAKDRMRERGISDADIRFCGKVGRAILQSDRKIKVVGFDCSGEELVIICVEENGVLLITVF